MSPPVEIGLTPMLERADGLLSGFEAALAGMVRETERGSICPSEMFFLYATVAPLARP